MKELELGGYKHSPLYSVVNRINDEEAELVGVRVEWDEIWKYQYSDIFFLRDLINIVLDITCNKI